MISKRVHALLSQQQKAWALYARLFAWVSEQDRRARHFKEYPALYAAKVRRMNALARELDNIRAELNKSVHYSKTPSRATLPIKKHG